jgi:hypothetical protein
MKCGFFLLVHTPFEHFTFFDLTHLIFKSFPAALILTEQTQIYFWDSEKSLSQMRLRNAGFGGRFEKLPFFLFSV